MKVLMTVSISLLFMLIMQLPVHTFTWDFKSEAELKDWTVITGKWTIEDGKLKGVDPEYIGIVAGDLEWEDYTLEVETTVAEGKYTYWMVRVQNDPLSYYTLERHEGNASPIWRRDAGQHTKVGNDVPLPDDHLKSHVWKIEVKGDTITAYLDGEELLSAEDKTYKKGRIGLGGHPSGSDTGRNIILFEYVKVEGPNIPANAAEPRGKLSVAWGSLKASY